MTIPLALQYLIVALAVLGSAWVVMRKEFPNTARALQVAMAVRLLREGRSGWMRALGYRIAPPGRGGGKDCGGCDGCD